MTETGFRRLQAAAARYVDEAMSGSVDLYREEEGGQVIPEAVNQDLSAAVLHELQRRDVQEGRDPAARITDELRGWLVEHWADLAARLHDEARGDPGC